MNIATWKSYFDTLQNKYGSPYFDDDQKSLFFNRAILDFVKSKLPGDKETNVELDVDSKTAIAPLIYTLTYQNMTSSGIITKATIASALTSISAGATVWRVMNIGWKVGNNYYPCKFTRDNDWFSLQANYFKRGYDDSPRYKEDYVNYTFSPINTGIKVYYTVLKYPVTVDIATSVDCDLPDFTHNEIIAIALELAGISSRDEALAQLLQLQNK